MPPSEPSANDVASVAAALGAQPQTEQQPAQMQPDPVTPQPAPTQSQPQPQAAPEVTGQPQDPFAAFGQPQTPTEPQAPPQQQTEPNPQPQQPTEPQSAPQPTQAPTEQFQTFDEYMASVTKGVGDTPAQPDPSKIDPDDPNAIKGFFDELVNTAVKRAEQTIAKKQAIQTAERQVWDAAFEKYPSLRTNKKARDLVHSIRMGHFQRGQAISPTQAADTLLESMGQTYKQGVADSQVVTTIQNVQPQGGGTGQPVPTTLDKQSHLEAIQTGGEQALTDYLQAKIDAGQL